MADDEFNEQDFYDHARRAEEYFAADVSRRHHRSAIKDLLHWMDRAGMAKAEGATPGAKAVQAAAIPDAENKELAGRLKLVDESKKEEPSDPTPVDEQPKGFDEAASKAHDIYMSALAKSDK